jgi:hypothetical protein
LCQPATLFGEDELTDGTKELLRKDEVVRRLGLLPTIFFGEDNGGRFCRL